MNGVGASDDHYHVYLYLMIDTRHEVEEARRHGIPIIVLVDLDKQTSREVIDKYMELGFSWLFDEQARETIVPMMKSLRHSHSTGKSRLVKCGGQNITLHYQKQDRKG